MNSPVIGLRVASVIFGLATLGLLTRLLLQLEVMVAGHHIPLWLSAIGLIVAATLCIWFWRLSVPASPPAADSDPTHHHPTPAAP